MTTKILGNQITNYTIETEQLSNTATAAFAKTLAPKIQYANVASNTYTVLDDAAVNVGGGYIVITGAEFQSGATVLIDTTQASAVSYINSTTLRAQVPAKSAASYNLYVVNPDGGVGIKVAGVTYSSEPAWVTTSPLSNVISNTVFSGTFNANGATSYANTTILPTGFNLLSNGYYYGNISVGTVTSYSFDIKATDAELQDSTKTFSLSATTLASYAVDYLVVAGGGCGGDGDSGGGGAGGMLTGTFTANIGIPYTLTVGSGAAGVQNSGGRGPAGIGGNSQIVSPGAPPIFSSIVTSGGGAGGGYNNGGTPGGSGGGASNTRGGQGEGVPGQGNSGGGPPGGGGGGKGSSGNGGGGYGSTAPGGAGALWPVTNTYYAGGGGNGMGGSGGIGGGGTGDGPPGFGPTGKNGAPGTGGGGGGSRGSGGLGGSGGDGVIILAMNSANYPGSAPGATVTTPPSAPGKTVLTYTNSGTFTA